MSIARHLAGIFVKIYTKGDTESMLDILDLQNLKGYSIYRR